MKKYRKMLNKNKKAIWQQMWSWPVVGPFVCLCIGGGWTFMTSAHSSIADLFFVASEALLLCKLVTWETLKNNKKCKIILVFVSLASLIIGIIFNHFLNKTDKMLVSPPEITISSPTNKDFILTITNNQDVTAYNVCLGVCLNYKMCDMSAIKIKPVKEEFLPDIPISMFRVVISNGCYGIVFVYIKPHDTKEFYVTIEGKKLNSNTKVAFRVYNWYLEPHFENITAKKDYVFRGAPQNFKELYDDKSKESEKTGHAYIMKMKLPVNPYFPEDKIDQKDYWMSAFTDF